MYIVIYVKIKKDLQFVKYKKKGLLIMNYKHVTVGF